MKWMFASLCPVPQLLPFPPFPASPWLPSALRVPFQLHSSRPFLSRLPVCAVHGTLSVSSKTYVRHQGKDENARFPLSSGRDLRV